MKVSHVRPGVLAFEVEKSDRRRVTPEALRSRGWGPAVLDMVKRSQARRAVPTATPEDDLIVRDDDHKADPQI